MNAQLHDNIYTNHNSNYPTQIDYTFLSQLTASSKISTELKRITRKIWYFKMKQKKYTEIERKSDTRAKIMMGGLIKKAGLDYLHPDNAEVLYGMLLENKTRIDSDPSTIIKWQEMGKDLTNVSKTYSKIL
jgi:Conjugal transfer protein TraD